MSKKILELKGECIVTSSVNIMFTKRNNILLLNDKYIYTYLPLIV